MDEDQYLTLLSALSDLQTSIDALSLDVQRILEHLGLVEEADS